MLKLDFELVKVIYKTMKFILWGTAASLLILMILGLASCVKIYFKTEELQPVQTNIDDGDLEIVLITETETISREASAVTHKRIKIFPPRIILFFKSNIANKNKQVVLNSVRLIDSKGVVIPLVVNKTNIILKDNMSQNIADYQTYSHLKYTGGQSVVKNILITRWIPEVKIDNQYILEIDYLNLDGIQKNLAINYDAKLNIVKRTENRFLYWNSI